MKSKSPSAAFAKSMPEPRHARRRSRLPAIAGALVSAFLLAACVAHDGERAAPANDPAPTAERQAIETTLQIQTPTPGWELAPLQLYRLSEKEYWAIHQLTGPDGMVAQMISSTETTFSFPHQAEEPPSVKHLVLGKTWNWDGNPEVAFIDSLDDIEDALAEAEAIPLSSD